MFLVVGVGCWEVFYFTFGGVFWFGLVFSFFVVVLLAWDFWGDGGAIALVKIPTIKILTSLLGSKII